MELLPLIDPDLSSYGGLNVTALGLAWARPVRFYSGLATEACW